MRTWAIEDQALNPAVCELETPAPVGSRQHRLATASDGRLLLSWVEETTGKTRAAVRYATREGQAWSQPHTVVTVQGKLADGPVVMGLTDGTLVASWMVSRSTPESPYAADLFLAHSRDDGQIWTQPIKPYGKAARIYDAQMSMSALADCKLALVWADQRGIRQLPQGGSEGSYRLMATVVDGNRRPGPDRLHQASASSVRPRSTSGHGQQAPASLPARKAPLPGHHSCLSAPWQAGPASTAELASSVEGASHADTRPIRQRPLKRKHLSSRLLTGEKVVRA